MTPKDPGFVTWLQTSLRDLVEPDLATDGSTGPRTIAAVKKFQKLRGLVSQWSQELENSGVRVLAFTPAPMRTTLRARAYFAEDAALLPTPEAEAARCVALIVAAAARD